MLALTHPICQPPRRFSAGVRLMPPPASGSSTPTMQTPKSVFLLAVIILLGGLVQKAPGQNTVYLQQSSYMVGENVGSAAIVVQVTRAAGNQDTITVSYATVDETAIAGSDYLATSGTVTFAPNETAKLVQVPIIDDLNSEPTETFSFTLSKPTNATLGSPSAATVTISDNDGSGNGINIIEFSTADYGSVETLGEGQPPATITLLLTAHRRGDLNQTLMIDVTVGQAGDTATNGTDYTFQPETQTITFPPGVNQVLVTVPVIYRPEAQGNTFFTAVLKNPGDLTSIGEEAMARGTIFDNSGANTVQLLTDKVQVREGGQASFTIPVFRTGSFNPNGATTVNFTTEVRPGDTAQAGVNFVSTSGTVTFAPIGPPNPIVDNEHVGFITILIPNNALIQGDVTFHVTLTSSDFAQLGPISSTQVTVLDDDLGNILQFSSANFTVSEAGPYTAITVNLIPNGDPSQNSLVDFAATPITAFAGFDFSPITTTLVFAPFEYSKTVLVPILEDNITEPTETFRVTVSNPSFGSVLGAQSTAIVSILDNDLSSVVQFSPVDYMVAENAGPVTLTVTVNRANNPSDKITVNYQTLANTATAGQDYVPVTSGTLVFESGETQKTLFIPITNDDLIEGVENFFVALTGATAETEDGQPSSASIGIDGTANITILDDDSPTATIGFSQASYDAGEGTRIANLIVTRSGGLGVSATINYSTSDGTAISGTNYVASTGTVTFAVGDITKTISIPIIDNATADPPLTFTVTLTAADGGFIGGRSTAIVNIIDNDATTFRFNPDTYTVNEGASSVTLTVEALRVGDPNDTISVDFITSDDSAKVDSNYTRAAGRLTFGPNVNFQTITVPIIDNNATDGTTDFFVSLSNPLGPCGASDCGGPPASTVRLGTPSLATVTIIDNDATTFQFGSSAYSANDQSGVASATVNLSRIGDPDATFSVSYSTSDLTAVAGQDYYATAGTLVFGPGVASQVINVPLIVQPVGSPTRQFEITLSKPTNGAFLGTNFSTTVTVINPDLSTKPINISTRGPVETGDGVMIAGFIVQGDSFKRVILRALGPSLTQLGVVGALQDPTLDLRDVNGVQLAYNDDFKETQEAEIDATNLVPTDDRESAIVTTLTPGNYTAILRGKTNGVGLVEVYDLDTTSATHLVNLSTRGKVNVGDSGAMIGGFIIDGQVSQQVLIRALGPSLSNFDVSGVLNNPTLDLYRGSQLILSNDNWKTGDQVGIQNSGLAPGNDLEAALLVTLDPGSYTAVVRGKNDSTGIALVEVYEVK